MHKMPNLTHDQNIAYHNASVLQARAWKKLQEAHPGGYNPQWVEDIDEWQQARQLIETVRDD